LINLDKSAKISRYDWQRFPYKGYRDSIKGHKYNPPSNIDEVNYYTQKSMGIDPGFGSSAFGVVVTQMSDRLMQVLEAEEYYRPDFNQMKMYYFRSKDEDTREDAYICALSSA
jgi:hypothetical protein